MQSDSRFLPHPLRRSVIIGAHLALGLIYQHCSAQTVTVADILASQTAKKAAAAVTLAPPRAKADVSLNAIFGADTLMFEVALNGKSQTVELGQDLRNDKTTCTLASYTPETRCIGISQTSRSGDICPASACWTGVPAPARAQGLLSQLAPPPVPGQVTSIQPTSPAGVVIPAIGSVKPIVPPLGTAGGRP